MTADTQSVRILAPADEVFRFMSDPARLDLWSFGTWRTEIASDGLVHGWAMATGAEIWLKIAAHPDQLLIDYHLGQAADALQPRIFARIVPGDVTGHEGSLLLMTALRGAGMDDDRWSGLIAAHGAELRIIKGLIETGYDHRTG